MMRKNFLKGICFLSSFFVCFSISSFKSFAHDDNPSGNTVSEFPTALEVEGNDYIMTNNNGTISAAKSPGEILYNFGTVSSLEGATVQENCKDATITQALNGTVKVNKGIIGKVSGTAKVNLNATGGVINQNLNEIEQNMGTVKENHSIIAENRGTIEKVGEAGTVSRHIEGAIGENKGTVTVVPDSKGIITAATIEKNSGTVVVEADTNNKSTVKIKENTNSLIIRSGADCIVENNSGTIQIEEGGKCILTGTSTTELPPSGVVYPDEGEYYRLILDNITSENVHMISNYKIYGGDIYVAKDKSFSFTIDDSKYSIMWSDDENNHIHSVKIAFIRDGYEGYVDDTAKTVKLHFHTLGSCAPSTVKEGYHEISCSNCPEVAKVEACSGGTATCKERAKCAKCNQEYGSVGTEHSFGEWITTKEASVGVEGTKYRKCRVCGFIENGTIPAKPKAEEPTGGENPSPDNNNNNSNANEPEKTNGNNGSTGKKDSNRNELKVEKAGSDENTALKEELQTATEGEVQGKTQSDVQSNVSSQEELPSEEENETENGSEEVLTEDTLSTEKPVSKGKGVMWPIAVVGAGVVVAISSVVAVRIKKKTRT